MSTTPSTPASGPSAEQIILGMVVELLPVAASFLSGTWQAELPKVAVVIADVAPMILNPTVAGLESVAQQLLTLAGQVTAGTVSEAVKAAGAIVAIAQSATAAIASIQGQPIDPANVPPENPVP